MAVLTERALDSRQRQLECELDPACVGNALLASSRAGREQQISDLLGTGKYARYQAFRDASEERWSVSFLCQHQPSFSALTDADAEKLIAALAEDRRQFIRDAESRGEQVNGVGRAASGGFIVRGSAVAGSPDEYARRIESATQYTQRMIARAAAMLTAEQSAAFKEMANGSLDSYTEQAEDRRAAKDARKADGDRPESQ